MIISGQLYAAGVTRAIQSNMQSAVNSLWMLSIVNQIMAIFLWEHVECLKNDVRVDRVAASFTLKCLREAQIIFVKNDKRAVVWWEFVCAVSFTFSPVLQEVQLPVIAEEDCRNAYSNDKNSPVIDNKFLCAGFLGVGKKDACQVTNHLHIDCVPKDAVVYAHSKSCYGNSF